MVEWSELITPTRARRAPLKDPQRRYAATSHSPTNPLRRSPLGHSVYLSPALGAPALVLIRPELHLRALRTITASHPTLEPALQCPFTREQQTSSPSNQHAPSSRPHQLCCSIQPRSAAAPHPALNADFVQSTTRLLHIAASLRPGLFHSDRSLTCPQSPPGLAAPLGLLSSTSLIFRPSGAPKSSVNNGFGLQDYYRIKRRPAELRNGAAILRPGKLRPPIMGFLLCKLIEY
ncbi:hypothetical protein NDU88_006616 [Pleurodeles waltl]|uniref:Uncharacterized protein n=1 Tax=Pleurodeles waltl TaxID=8319 RepID=A0AAV7RSI0_PLEWA|nr:hypothetical protein NDU88_006616 [Pleurodeles waltl]